MSCKGLQNKNPWDTEKHIFVLHRLVVKGYRSPLQAEDLWSLREEDTSEKIICDLEKEWAKQWAKIQQ